MKQLTQNLKTGETTLADVPVPAPGRGKILIRTSRSLVSLGTERMLVQFGKANLFQKARQQPDKVRQVLDKIRSEGLMPTVEAVFKKLDEPLPLGYCNVGRISEVGGLGASIGWFRVGDRVASNGGHAEFVCVPENLCALVPDNVSDEEAAFTVVGAIALQGVRLCNPTFGETVVVVGLGLIGLLTAQFLLANGCRVIGLDIAPEKLDLAAGWGVLPVNPMTTDPVAAVMQATGDIGADGVIITASAKGDDIVHQAAQMSRKRGRIILVGVVGLNLNRADFYEKELTFQVSCSYGPGRYDDTYEQKGVDYPVGFVRWTEKRNFEAVLQAISTGRLDVKSLITERVPLAEYRKIYGEMGKSGAIASILEYPEAEASPRIERTIRVSAGDFKGVKGTMAIIGAGNFAKMTMLPALKKCSAPISYISSANGLTGTHLARKYGIPNSTTDYREILSDPKVGMVLITTRHNLHAPMVIEALKAGKHVFTEKPLCITPEELNEIINIYTPHPPTSDLRPPTPDIGPPTPDLRLLTVGFNRRFSPHIQAIKKALGNSTGPMNLSATMNAGAIPPNVWVHDMAVGGGRIIGEACHFLDLLAYLAGSPIEAVCMNALGPEPEINTDNATILLRFANGSNGVVNYFANGHKAYSKERVEVYTQGRIVIMDNFRRTEAFGFNGFRGLKTKIDKGHAAQFKLLTERFQNGGQPLIPFHEIENVTRASFACIESLMRGGWVEIGGPRSEVGGRYPEDRGDYCADTVG